MTAILLPNLCFDVVVLIDLDGISSTFSAVCNDSHFGPVGPPLCSQPYELATSQDLWIGRRVCNLSFPQCRDEDNFGDADDLSQQRVPHAAFWHGYISM